jgi:hypothetical protein
MGQRKGKGIVERFQMSRTDASTKTSQQKTAFPCMA